MVLWTSPKVISNVSSVSIGTPTSASGNAKESLSAAMSAGSISASLSSPPCVYFTLTVSPASASKASSPLPFAANAVPLTISPS